MHDLETIIAMNARPTLAAVRAAVRECAIAELVRRVEAGSPSDAEREALKLFSEIEGAASEPKGGLPDCLRPSGHATRKGLGYKAERDPGSIADEYGGYWGEHPVHGWQDWARDAEENNTRQGYWDWLEATLEAEKELGDL